MLKAVIEDEELRFPMAAVGCGARWSGQAGVRLKLNTRRSSSGREKMMTAKENSDRESRQERRPRPESGERRRRKEKKQKT